MPIMYEEYMITPFILTPMPQDQMKRILKERVSIKRSHECKGKRPEEQGDEKYILEKTFDNLFMFLQS